MNFLQFHANGYQGDFIPLAFVCNYRLSQERKIKVINSLLLLLVKLKESKISWKHDDKELSIECNKKKSFQLYKTDSFPLVEKLFFCEYGAGFPLLQYGQCEPLLHKSSLKQFMLSCE
ncbi:Hypothetical predicted protein, partial [Scomber scombrus]